MEYAKKNTEDPKLLLSVKEACKLTGVSEKTMRSLAYEQKMMVRIGKRTLIHKKKLEKWIDHQGLPDKFI